MMILFLNSKFINLIMWDQDMRNLWITIIEDCWAKEYKSFNNFWFVLAMIFVLNLVKIVLGI